MCVGGLEIFGSYWLLQEICETLLLTKQNRKDIKFKYFEECEKSLKALKIKLEIYIVFTLPLEGIYKFKVYNASKDGLGGVLIQQGKVII